MDDEILISTIKDIVEETHADDRRLMVSLIERHESGVQHQFIKVEIERQARNQEMWDRLKGNVIFWALTGITGALGLIVWNQFKGDQ